MGRLSSFQRLKTVGKGTGAEVGAGLQGQLTRVETEKRACACETDGGGERQTGRDRDCQKPREKQRDSERRTQVRPAGLGLWFQPLREAEAGD